MISILGLIVLVTGASDMNGTFDSPNSPNLSCVRIVQSIQNPSIWRYRVFHLNSPLYEAHPTEDYLGIQVQTGDSFYTRQTASINFATTSPDEPQVKFLDQEASLASGWPHIYSESKKWSATFDPNDFQLRVFRSDKPTGTPFLTFDMKNLLERALASPLKPGQMAPRFRFNFDPRRPEQPEDLLNVLTPFGFQDLDLSSGKVVRNVSFAKSPRRHSPQVFPWDGDSTITYDQDRFRVFSPLTEPGARLSVSHGGEVQFALGAAPLRIKKAEFIFLDSAVFPDGRQRLVGTYLEIQTPDKRGVEPRQFIRICEEDGSLLARFKFRKHGSYESPHAAYIGWARSDGRSLLTYSPDDRILIWHNLEAPEITAIIE